MIPDGSLPSSDAQGAAPSSSLEPSAPVAPVMATIPGADERIRQYEAEIAAMEADLLGEIGSLQRAAAERERALTAERDAYRRQLALAKDTKGWRASAAITRARARGMKGLLSLVPQLGAYVARIGYHTAIPYRVRRDMWFRRNTHMSYRAYYRQLNAPAHASADATGAKAGLAAGAADSENISLAVGPDILYFSADAWQESSYERRRLVHACVDAGHRCFWVNPLLPAPDTGSHLPGVREAVAHPSPSGIEAVDLPGYGVSVTTGTAFRPSVLRRALASLRAFCSARDARDVLIVAQHPGWAPLVSALQQRYGWKVMYDLQDTSDLAALRVDRMDGDTRVSDTLTCDLIIAHDHSTYERVSARGIVPALLWPETDGYGALRGEIRRLYGRATIIIVSYSNFDALRLTLRSVLEKTRYPHYDVLIVDNGGRADIQAYLSALAERFPEMVRVIFNAENLGFAGGNNVGLHAARESAYVVLLNDDVIVTPGWLGGLIRYLDDNGIGMVGPVTNAIGNEARIAVDYSDPVSEVDAFARRYTFDHDGVSFDIPALAMFCVAMRQDVATQIGELDERFRFGMFEDDDYAVRLHRAGYRVVCAEDVFIHHAGSASFGKMGEDAFLRLFNANRTLFEEKWRMEWQPHKYREGYQP